MDVLERFPPERTINQEFDSLLFTAEGQANWRLEFDASAHVLACLQCMHCIGDTLAQVIFKACGPSIPKLGQLGEWQATLEKISTALAHTPGFELLNRQVDLLCDCADFIYLNDVVNHSKHRRIIGLDTTVSATTDELAQPLVEIGAFVHVAKKGTTQYAARDPRTFLIAEYDRQSELIVAICLEISKKLQ